LLYFLLVYNIHMSFIFLQELILGAITIINFIIGSYVLLHNPQNIVNRSFFVFVLGITFWGVGIVFIFATKLFLFDKVIFYGTTLMAFGFLLLAKTFPDGGIVEKKFWLHTLPFIVIALVIPFNIFVSKISFTETGSIEPTLEPGFLFYIIIMGFYTFFGLYLLARKYLQSLGRARLQIEIVL